MNYYKILNDEKTLINLIDYYNNIINNNIILINEYLLFIYYTCCMMGGYESIDYIIHVIVYYISSYTHGE